MAGNQITSEQTTTQSTAIAYLNRRYIFQVAIIGLIVGIVAWIVSRIFLVYIFHPSMCSLAANNCQSTVGYTDTITTLTAALLGSAFLVAVRQYRPLFTVLGTAVGLWGLVTLLEPANWLAGLIVMALSYGLSYALFTWVGRIRNFSVAFLVTALLAAALQVCLNV